MAGGGSPENNGRRLLCGRTGSGVDLSFWSPDSYNIGLRSTVFFRVVGCFMSPSGHSAHHNHGLPPAVQWDGGKSPLPTEGLALGQISRRQVAGTPSMGVFGPQSGTQGQQQRFFR